MDPVSLDPDQTFQVNLDPLGSGSRVLMTNKKQLEIFFIYYVPVKISIERTVCVSSRTN